MSFKTIRIIFWLLILFLAATLWSQWNLQFNVPKASAPVGDSHFQSSQSTKQISSNAGDDTVPDFNTEPPKTQAGQDASANGDEKVNTQDIIRVHTDVYDIQLNLVGGNVVSAQLKDYPESLSDKTPLSLLSANTQHYYIAQSGLTNIPQVNHLHYRAAQSTYILKAGQKVLEVPLYARADNLVIEKVYSFKPDSYEIDVKVQVKNEGSQTWKGALFGQMVRTPPVNSEGIFGHYTTFTGAALSSPQNHYNKQSFSDMQSNPTVIHAKSGWAAMVQHYFIGAWIPTQAGPTTFYSKAYNSTRYAAGILTQTASIAPHQSAYFTAKMYVGPAIAERLDQAAPHLSLAIDYGWLWFISDPIFSVMNWVHSFAGNWGIAIILVTLLIKLIFYPLSAKSYRSMARMRRLQPKMQQIRERFGSDKQKMSQATMELYRKEKVNPLGGCLPMIIQIPVFIALYWVIVESVEFRQAPFFFWIHDLSAKDPFYILPILMGLSMFVQQKLNPTPPDPTQAKIMMALPVVFTILFAHFPSGLVLYWLANNCFSILQQWWVMRKVNQETTTQASKAKK